MGHLILSKISRQTVWDGIIIKISRTDSQLEKSQQQVESQRTLGYNNLKRFVCIGHKGPINNKSMSWMNS